MFIDDRFTKLDRDSAGFVNTRTDQAMWYAWGAIDALKRTEPRIGQFFSDDDVYAFGHLVFSTAITFRLGEANTMPAIQDHWMEFVEDKAVGLAVDYLIIEIRTL